MVRRNAKLGSWWTRKNDGLFGSHFLLTITLATRRTKLGNDLVYAGVDSGNYTSAYRREIVETPC